MTKREIIMVAGQRLFSKYGPTKTTVEDIIRYAHVAKGTFYKHFPDKGVLFLEVAQMEVEKFMEALREAVDAAPNAREKVRAYLSTALQKSKELENFSDITQHTFPSILPRLQAMRDGILDREREVISGILAEGVEKGEIEVTDVDRSACAVLAGIGIHRSDVAWILDYLPMAPEILVDDIVHMLFDGIKAR